MKNRKFFRTLSIALTIAAALALSVSVGASNLLEKTITVNTGVRIFMDGVELIPRGVNGQEVETFVYNGTTYVPIRAISEAYKKAVKWDGTDGIVYIGEVPGEKMYLKDVCPPYQTDHIETRDYVELAGNRYMDNMVSYLQPLSHSSGWALYNLNGQFSALEFDVGHVDGGSMDGKTLNIYLDGELAYTKELTGEMLPEHIVVPLNGALQMKIEFSASFGEYAIVNATIE